MKLYAKGSEKALTIFSRVAGAQKKQEEVRHKVEGKSFLIFYLRRSYLNNFLCVFFLSFSALYHSDAC
jgi:hypothetical protein